jgi:hypothetical protein
MTRIDDFLHQYADFSNTRIARKTSLPLNFRGPERYIKFFSHLMALFEHKRIWTSENIALFTDEKFCKETWRLPTPFLVERQRFNEIDHVLQATYHNYVQEINGNYYYVYQHWSREEAAALFFWYKSTKYGVWEDRDITSMSYVF